MTDSTADVLIIGAGPAGVALAAALSANGLRVHGLSPAPPDGPWPNTYGIWRDELEAPGLTPDWLGQQWQNCVVYAAVREIPLSRTYGLFDNARLQADLLARCAAGGVVWHQGLAGGISHTAVSSQVHTQDGRTLTARLVVDASGHRPVFAWRPAKQDVAMQAAYGIVGRFSRPPVQPQQMVLMDFRSDHLTAVERQQPPTFLYAMDFGEGVYFVEETSLAHYPAVSYEVLEQRLHRRLAHHGITITEVQHVEHCLFPMNLPLPSLRQPVFAYGGAASMVHPVSGYQVGAALRYAPAVAQAIAQALGTSDCSPATAAHAAWQALWPPDRLRKRALYLFGLDNLLRFDDELTQEFFATFFDLPWPQWTGYLSNTLTTPGILQAMGKLFLLAPNRVRWKLLASIKTAPDIIAGMAANKKTFEVFKTSKV